MYITQVQSRARRAEDEERSEEAIIPRNNDLRFVGGGGFPPQKLFYASQAGVHASSQQVSADRKKNLINVPDLTSCEETFR